MPRAGLTAKRKSKESSRTRKRELSECNPVTEELDRLTRNVDLLRSRVATGACPYLRFIIFNDPQTTMAHALHLSRVLSLFSRPGWNCSGSRRLRNEVISLGVVGRNEPSTVMRWR
jgi:hypothetical protein